jgi:hypothetical protein
VAIETAIENSIDSNIAQSFFAHLMESLISQRSQEALDQLRQDFAFSLAALEQHNKQYPDNR